MSKGIGISPHIKSMAYSVLPRKPADIANDDVVTGALSANSNLRSVTFWISSHISSLSVIVIMPSGLSRCTKVMAPN